MITNVKVVNEEGRVVLMVVMNHAEYSSYLDMGKTYKIDRKKSVKYKKANYSSELKF